MALNKLATSNIIPPLALRPYEPETIITTENFVGKLVVLEEEGRGWKMRFHQIRQTCVKYINYRQLKRWSRYLIWLFILLLGVRALFSEKNQDCSSEAKKAEWDGKGILINLLKDPRFAPIERRYSLSDDSDPKPNSAVPSLRWIFFSINQTRNVTRSGNGCRGGDRERWIARKSGEAQ